MRNPEKVFTCIQDLASPVNSTLSRMPHSNKKTKTQIQPSADSFPTDTPKYITSHNPAHQREKSSSSYQNIGTRHTQHEAYTNPGSILPLTAETQRKKE